MSDTAAAHIDRRALLLAGAAGALVPFAAGRHAAMAQQAPGNAGTYGFHIGDLKATVVSDGTLTGSPRIYAGDAPADALDRVLGRAFLPTDNFVLNLNALLLEIGGNRKVLIEAGAAQTFGPTGERLVANLAAIGVRPDDIDAIVVTHAHPDHVGNLRRDDGGAAFPNAAVHIPEADWAFFVRNEPDLSRLPMNDDFRRRFIASIKRSVEPISKTVVLYGPGAELLPGVATIAAGGHTPGMSALLIHSGRDQLLVTADAAYDPLLNMEHGWRPGPDLDPEAALQTRRHLFDRAAADRIPVLGFHFPFPGLGHVRAEGGAYGWVPARWRFDF